MQRKGYFVDIKQAGLGTLPKRETQTERCIFLVDFRGSYIIIEPVGVRMEFWRAKKKKSQLSIGFVLRKGACQAMKNKTHKKHKAQFKVSMWR